MATLTANKPLDAADTTLSVADSNAGPHDFEYNSYKQVIYITNNEAVPLTFNFLGDGVTTFTCPAYGDIDVSGGYDVVVAAGTQVTLYTQQKEAYMGSSGNSVTVTVTGSTTTALSYIWMVEHN